MSDANNSPEQEGGRALTRFTRDVLRAALVDVASKALVAVGISLGGLILLVASVLVSAGSVPAWSIAVALVVIAAISAVALVLADRLAAARRDNSELEGRVEDLRARADRVPDLEDERDRIEAEVELHESYGRHVRHILDHFQKVLSGAIEDVSVTAFIERGILQPARDVLADQVGNPRLSVLRPKGDDLKMAWAAGHDLESKQKYSLPLRDSLARICFEEGAVETWDDVTSDPRFKPHPKARRDFHSMISYPIRVGDEVKAVLNVISDDVAAFGPAETNYLTAIGSVVALAVGVAIKEERKRRSTDGKR